MTSKWSALSLKDFHLHEDHLRRTSITSFLMTDLDHFVPSSMGFPVDFPISHCILLPNLPLPPPLPQAVPAIAQSAGDSSALPSVVWDGGNLEITQIYLQ